MNEKKLIRTILHKIHCSKDYCETEKRLCEYFNGKDQRCDLFKIPFTTRARNKQCKDLIGEENGK